jgi:hypothetical protein
LIQIARLAEIDFPFDLDHVSRSPW